MGGDANNRQQNGLCDASRGTDGERTHGRAEIESRNINETATTVRPGGFVTEESMCAYSTKHAVTRYLARSHYRSDVMHPSPSEHRKITGTYGEIGVLSNIFMTVLVNKDGEKMFTGSYGQ